MRLKTLVTFIICLLLLLASCDSYSGASQTPIFTLKPVFTLSPISTALDSTSKPSITFSPAQATQTASYARFIQGKQTQESLMFTVVPATLEARNVQCKDGFVIEQYLDIISSSNNQWTLYTCSPTPLNKNDEWTPGVVDYGTRYTQIIKTDFSKTWTIRHNTFDYSIINRPDALLSPYRWTADGKYLYLYPSSYPGGSGFPESAFLYTQIGSLYRINLETGKFELVLQRSLFGALALSPDDRLLAYSEPDKSDIIHIRNMENGTDLQIKLNEDISAAGAFIWNSQSTKVIFTVGYGKQNGNWQDDLSGTSVFVLTPQNMHVQKVLAKDSRIFSPYECSDNIYWLNENTICLYSLNQDLDSWNKIFTLNIKTGTVTYLRPSP